MVDDPPPPPHDESWLMTPPPNGYGYARYAIEIRIAFFYLYKIIHRSTLLEIYLHFVWEALRSPRQEIKFFFMPSEKINIYL